MQIANIQGQSLTNPISLESALLELLEIASSVTVDNPTAQITTDYSNDNLTASVTLPIQQDARIDGTVVISAIQGSIPDLTAL